MSRFEAGTAGAAVEKKLNDYHRGMLFRGEGQVFKVPTHVEISTVIETKRGKKATGYLGSPVWVDYAGVLCDGRALAMDAKFRTGDRVLRSHLEHHQIETLARVHGFGGVSIVYAVALVPGSDTKVTELVVPWSVLDRETSVLFGDPLWTRPLGSGWYNAAERWDRYQEGGWPALQE